MHKLQYITHDIPGYPPSAQAIDMCKAGVRWIQLRMKNASDEHFVSEGNLIREICNKFNALFIVNDRVSLVNELNADGVHIGKEDMPPLNARKLIGPDKIIGCTANTLQDILDLVSLPINYIGLGPLRYTATKEKLSPALGYGSYEEIMRALKSDKIHIPVYAIGGVRVDDIPVLKDLGLYGVAVSGVLREKQDKTQLVQLITNQFKSNAHV